MPGRLPRSFVCVTIPSERMDTYVDWARRFIVFHDKRHPIDMGATEVVPIRPQFGRHAAHAKGHAASVPLNVHRL